MSENIKTALMVAGLSLATYTHRLPPEARDGRAARRQLPFERTVVSQVPPYLSAAGGDEPGTGIEQWDALAGILVTPGRGNTLSTKARRAATIKLVRERYERAKRR